MARRIYSEVEPRRIHFPTLAKTGSGVLHPAAEALPRLNQKHRSSNKEG